MIGFASRAFGPWVRSVDGRTLRADALAGILGALLVLPQGFAFATLAGLPPEYGLYTAIVPCVVAALFGSSWHVVSGPTNANSLALFAMLAPLAAVGSPAYVQVALVVTVLVSPACAAYRAIWAGGRNGKPNGRASVPKPSNSTTTPQRTMKRRRPTPQPATIVAPAAKSTG